MRYLKIGSAIILVFGVLVVVEFWAFVVLYMFTTIIDLIVPFNSVVVYFVIYPVLLILLLNYLLYNKSTLKKTFISFLVFTVVFCIGINSYLFIKLESLKKFNSQLWAERLSVRMYMAEDLIDNYLVKDMKKNEVLKLMGQPTRDANDVLEYQVYYGSPIESEGKLEFLILYFEDNTLIEIKEKITVHY